MRILMVASEAVPFAKTGGLADVVSALSYNLKNQGHDVRIVMPRYYKINREKLTAIPGPLGIHIGFAEYWAEVYTTTLPNSSVPVYFIDYEECFGREGIYGSVFEPDFKDNPKRFSMLCHGAFELCRKEGWIPDIMHAHDWPTALIPVLLKFGQGYDDFKNTASVFTIHNIGYQGIYNKMLYAETGIDWVHFYNAGFEDWDRINFLKAGLISSDQLTTVSPTYAKEIQKSEYGFRMEAVLQYRNNELTGILNGVDTDVWNPSTDRYIPYPYKTPAGKAKNKAALQTKLGLPKDKNIPLFGMVTRLTDQKGVAELFGPAYGSAFKICQELPIQLVVLGSGDRWCENELHSLAQKLPNLKVYIGYDEELSHLIEAGSDFFLMPSRYEPCGLNQMYSLLYGTLPIVRNTGGLADTVENYNPETKDGTGFIFDNLTPQGIYDIVSYAVKIWNEQPEHIKKMRRKAMKQDFSWDSSAKKYLAVYEKAYHEKEAKNHS
ncbi:MAG: glycogen synthase GlgA [Treponema sp.]